MWPLNMRQAGRSPDPHAIAERSLFAGRDVHQAGLVGEFAVELRRTDIAVPGFDADKRRACWLRPDAEFAKPLPGNVDRWPAIGGIAHGSARNPVHDDRIIGEQAFGESKRLAVDR